MWLIVFKMSKKITLLSFSIHALIILFCMVGGWKEKIYENGEKELSLLDTALKIAGGNRKELEKVLNHYQMSKDSLKYQAACFLIENLPYYSYWEEKNLEAYYSYYINLRNSQKTPQELSDSILEIYGPIKQAYRKYDIQEVDSAYLCNNIDWAFKVWREQPWGKNVTFDVFCEYILPHRIADEPLSLWREKYYNTYNSLLDGLRNSSILDKENPIVVARYLIEKLPVKDCIYTSSVPVSLGHIGPKYVEGMTGSCREFTDFGVYLLRALGIPCTIDFVPVRSSVNASHFWLICWDKEGEAYMCDFPSSFTVTHKSGWYSWDDSAKVYRFKFSLNKEMNQQLMSFGEPVYPFWNNPQFVDVTISHAYYYNTQLKIPAEKIYKEGKKGKIAYLCMSNRDEWIPVDWTEYEVGNLVFKDVKKGAIIRIAVYDSGNLYFITDPFYVDKVTNKQYYYSCDREKQDVVLYAKYTLNDDLLFIERMLGGVFEASNQDNFVERDTLYIIQQKPYRLNTTVKSWSGKKYRYLRYIGAKDTYCNIADITFYTDSGDTIPIKGKPIGTPGCFQHDSSHDYIKALDGKSWTSFDYSEATGGWTGIKLTRPMSVEKISYTPRNRDNYIRPGDVFELFYCDVVWKSAGVAYAQSDSLVFKNIPKNALLLLRNHTRGIQERIFTYEKGIQVWK